MSRSTKAKLAAAQAAPLWRILAVAAIALTTANCAKNPQKFAASSGSGIDPKYGVKASPRVYNEGDVIPKGGGRRFSGKPYVVAGRTYVPREDAKGYVREGLASWYGAAFHGRLTANGEVFDRASIAAAHPTMPLPSYARVTNLANGHSMIVRVNDRGPYHADRVMDVSEEVAQALDFRRRGTARVRVEYVGKASTAGSDDRKLMATLRTDGEPAAVRGRAPVMMADLGPEASDASTERLSRSARPALAFRPNPEVEAEEAMPPARPVRAAPIVMASAATVAVPAALQPTNARSAPFRPSPVAVYDPVPAQARTAQAGPRHERPYARMAAAGHGLPGPTDPAGSRAAGSQVASARNVAAMPEGKGVRAGLRPVTGAGARAAAVTPPPSAVRAVAPLPTASKLAIAKLAASSPPSSVAARAKPQSLPAVAASAKLPAAPRRAQIAEIY